MDAKTQSDDFVLSPQERLTRWCHLCGAKIGEPCRKVDTPDGRPGDVRAEPHRDRGYGTRGK